MARKTEKDKGLNQEQIKTIFLNYINAFKNNTEKEDEIIEWVNLIAKNDIVKEKIVEIINGLNSQERLAIIKVIKNIDDSLLKESVNKIISDSECANLQDVINKLNLCKIGKNIIKNPVKGVLDNLTKEDDEARFRCFLEFVVNNELADKAITAIMINKIRPLLSTTNEEIIFSLKIIDKLKDIDAKKKKMIKIILDGLDDNDFDDEGKKLLSEVRKKL